MKHHDHFRAEIRRLHECDACWLENVRVVVKMDDDRSWTGSIAVFQVDHARASRAYAWAYFTRGTTMMRQLVVVLGVEPIDSPHEAVLAAIARGMQICTPPRGAA